MRWRGVGVRVSLNQNQNVSEVHQTGLHLSDHFSVQLVK